jgi:hypothetical protein
MASANPLHRGMVEQDHFRHHQVYGTRDLRLEAPWLFGDLLPTSLNGEAEPLMLEQKESRAFTWLKERAEERTRRKKHDLRKWDPAVGEAVLVETHHLLGSNWSITQKFMCPYEGPFWITKMVSPSILDISDDKRGVNDIFNVSKDVQNREVTWPYLKTRKK